MHAIRRVLQGTSWAYAFDECGYSENSNNIRSQIKAIFARGGELDMSLPTHQPTPCQLMELMPKKGVCVTFALLELSPAAIA